MPYTLASKCKNNNSLLKHLILPFIIHFQLGSTDEIFTFVGKKISTALPLMTVIFDDYFGYFFFDDYYGFFSFTKYHSRQTRDPAVGALN